MINLVHFIKERMASKDDVRAIIHDEVPGIIGEFVPGVIAREVAPMRHQLKDIEDRLDTRSLSTTAARAGLPQ